MATAGYTTMLWQEMGGRKDKDGNWNYGIKDSITRAVEYFKRKYPELDKELEIGINSVWMLDKEDKKIIKELEKELGVDVRVSQQAYAPTILFVTGKLIS